MKTFVITLSKYFPVTHTRAGQPTYFKCEFLNALEIARGNIPQYSVPNSCFPYERLGEKRHTIRANYQLWKKRIEEIQNGEACLSVRQWTGKPYRSKQIELARLTKDDGVGIEELTYNPSYVLSTGEITERYFADGVPVFSLSLSNNDGLNYKDWIEWFKNYDKSKPMAIIHVTKFRYSQII